MNIKFKLNKLYYKYINTSIVNHYRLLLLTEEYRKIGKDYFDKYPNAKGWINVNKELFDSNKQAEIEYIACSKKQAKIKKDFFENREIICKNNKTNNKTNKTDLIICSDYFQDFYVARKYHYEQFTENIIENIITDITDNKKMN
jgi:hypothetical protein